jgi:hypothetical protein
MRELIKLKATYEEQSAEAAQKYAENQTFFYSPMEPEKVDESVTNLIVASKLKPVSLSMNTLSSYDAVPYDPLEFVESPLDDLDTAGAGESGGAETSAETDAEAADDSSRGTIGSAPVASDTLDQNSDTLPDITQGGSSDVPTIPTDFVGYTYDVNVSATGTMQQLYNLLAMVNENKAMHIVRLDVGASSSGSGSSGSSNSNSANSDRSFSLQFRLYVYVPIAAVKELASGATASSGDNTVGAGAGVVSG